MEEGEHRAALPRAKRYDEQAPRSFPFSSLPRIGEEEKKPARSAYLFHVFPVPCPSPNIFPILLRLVILSPSLLAAKLKEPKQKKASAHGQRWRGSRRLQAPILFRFRQSHFRYKELRTQFRDVTSVSAMLVSLSFCYPLAEERLWDQKGTRGE